MFHASMDSLLYECVLMFHASMDSLLPDCEC